MADTHEFYPMFNRTIKSLLKIPSKNNLWEYLRVISDFPDYSFVGNGIDGTDGVMQAILSELNRQYMRWNKGGIK